MLKTFEASYAQKDYAQALEILKANRASFSSVVWDYNMGTVLAKLDRLPEARAHFLKAQAKGLYSSELLQNLSLTEEKLDLGRAEKSISVTDYVYRAGFELSSGYYVTIFLLILVTGLVALKRSFSWARVVGLVLCLSVLFGFRFWIGTKSEFVVLEPVTVQEGPSQIFSKVAEVPAGVRLLGKEEGNWFRIDYPARYTGWITVKNLIKLER